MWKMTAGYYNDTLDYIVLADSEEEARRKVLLIVRKEVHPKADIIIGSEVEFKSCGNGIWKERY